MIISNELLSAILNKKVAEVIVPVDDNNLKLNEIGFYTPDEFQIFHKINIYELMAKAKDWVHDENYIRLFSTKMESGVYNVQIGIDTNDHIGDTEYEAVFSACQEVLEGFDENN